MYKDSRSFKWPCRAITVGRLNSSYKQTEWGQSCVDHFPFRLPPSSSSWKISDNPGSSRLLCGLALNSLNCRCRSTAIQYWARLTLLLTFPCRVSPATMGRTLISGCICQQSQFFTHFPKLVTTGRSRKRHEQQTESGYKSEDCSQATGFISPPYPH